MPRCRPLLPLPLPLPVMLANLWLSSPDGWKLLPQYCRTAVLLNHWHPGQCSVIITNKSLGSTKECSGNASGMQQTSGLQPVALILAEHTLALVSGVSLPAPVEPEQAESAESANPSILQSIQSAARRIRSIRRLSQCGHVCTPQNAPLETAG